MAKLTSSKRLRLATDQDKPAAKFRVPKRPKSIPAAMQDEFRELVRYLHDQGKWETGKLQVLETLLNHKYLERQCVDVLVREGVTGLSVNTGDSRPHPATVVLNKVATVVLRCNQMLGLVSDTRGGLNNPEGRNGRSDGEPVNPWQKPA